MNEYTVIGIVVAAFILAGVLSYFFTPPVKRFAHKVGAIDVPKDNRRMHKEPIPRLGGLAIFGGFLCSILVFGQLDQTMLCVLLGATIIVALGIFDDVLALGAKLKFIVQIIAAAIPVCVGGLQISLFTNLNPFSDAPFWHLGFLAVPVTIIWIVGITNAVNLIDGLDGLAVGVSSIADGETLPLDGVFVALGTAGSTDFARKLGAPLDGTHIRANADGSTAVPGLFAAGDCTGGLLQIAKAVSDGAQAAMSAVKFLRK